MSKVVLIPALLASAALIVACLPTAESRYKDYRGKIADETAALIADRPLNSFGDL